MRYAVAALVGLGAILIGTLYLILAAPNHGDEYASCRSTRIAGGIEALGGDFTLMDESGALVSAQQVFERPSLVYFGYSFCPDVCPIDSVRNSEVVGILQEQGHDIGHVFISIDPAVSYTHLTLPTTSRV